jgi:hypothetical protein
MEYTGAYFNNGIKHWRSLKNARKPAHLAFVRYYSLNATEIDRQCLYAFPDWRDYRDEFDFTSLHLAALDEYPQKTRLTLALKISLPLWKI